MASQTPKVGEMVVYNASTEEIQSNIHNGATQLAAVVTQTWTGTRVNLCVFSPTGGPMGRMSVPYRHSTDGQMSADTGACTWEPEGEATPVGQPMQSSGVGGIGPGITENLGYDVAVRCVKRGLRIARAGWNGKNMFVYLQRGRVDFDALRDPSGVGHHNWDLPNHIEGVPIDLFDNSGPGTSTLLPNLNMQAASGSTVTGWLASQTDQLAEDWCIVPFNDAPTLPAQS